MRYQFDINLSVCTIYGPAAQYVFNIDNLLKGQLLDWTFVLIVHWCFCSNTRYLGFLVFWSYKLFFLSFWPKKLRCHNKRWVTTLQKGIFKYIRSKCWRWIYISRVVGTRKREIPFSNLTIVTPRLTFLIGSLLWSTKQHLWGHCFCAFS